MKCWPISELDQSDRDMRLQRRLVTEREYSWLLSATGDQLRRSKQHSYSITSSARASSVDGTVMPSALAVLRLITNSYLVGACTGRSAGFSPLRMRST